MDTQAGVKRGVRDRVEQYIEENVSVAARALAERTPKFLRESALWQLIQPMLSVLIAQLTPDGDIWERVDMIRAEFFSEYRHALWDTETKSRIRCPQCKGAGWCELN